MFSLWITSPGAVHDGVEHCAALEVEAADIYESGRIPDSRFGIVFFSQSWSINRRPVTKMTTIDDSFFGERIPS
jgi:hypothetical protein